MLGGDWLSGSALAAISQRFCPVSRHETLRRHSGAKQPSERAMNTRYLPDRFVFVALVIATLIANLPW